MQYLSVEWLTQKTQRKATAMFEFEALGCDQCRVGPPGLLQSTRYTPVLLLSVV